MILRYRQALAACALALSAAAAMAAESARPNLIGKAAPGFTLPVVSQPGANARTAAWSLKGAPARPTVLLFISTQCPVSTAYDARMAALAKDYRARGVDVIGINSNKAEAADEIDRHARQNALGFPVLKDAGNKVADLYDAQVTPEAYVIDTRGVIRYHGRLDNSRNTASVNTQDLRNALDDILSNRAVRTARTQAFGCGIKRAG